MDCVSRASGGQANQKPAQWRTKKNLRPEEFIETRRDYSPKPEGNQFPRPDGSPPHTTRENQPCSSGSGGREVGGKSCAERQRKR